MTIHAPRHAVGVAVLLACMPAEARPPQSEPLAAAQRQAADVVAAFHAALQRGDTAGAASHLADEALIYEGGGVERGKAEYASHHLPADAAFAKALQRSVTRTSSHALGELAWVATESTSKGAYKGKPVDSVGTETMILRRSGGTWRIAHIHWSSAVAKPARAVARKKSAE